MLLLQELHAMVGAVKRIQRAWRKLAAKRGYLSSLSGASAGSSSNSRPLTPNAAAAAAAAAAAGVGANASGGRHPQGSAFAGDETPSSFLSSGPSSSSFLSCSSSYSLLSGCSLSDGRFSAGMTSATSATLTAGSSSMLGTPESLSGYMSGVLEQQQEGLSNIRQQQQQQLLQQQGSSQLVHAGRSSGVGMPDAKAAAGVCNTAAGVDSSGVDLLAGLGLHQAAVGDSSSVRPTPRIAGTSS
jgi:hypothetical protein